MFLVSPDDASTNEAEITFIVACSASSVVAGLSLFSITCRRLYPKVAANSGKNSVIS
jgi:hypothetical protein